MKYDRRAPEKNRQIGQINLISTATPTKHGSTVALIAKYNNMH